MTFRSDFHIHSPFSLATSSRLNCGDLDLWSRIKGIDLIGSGDIAHPGWTAVLRESLQPAEPGLFTLRKDKRRDSSLPHLAARPCRFLLCGEVSNVYRAGGKSRRIHSLLFFPDFESVETFQKRLESLGKNIRSDGRPVLGMNVRDLLEMCLEISSDILLVPAHIWTPWYSLLGAKSGFDSLRECFRDLTPHIFAVETGLSSDPPMNRRCRFLDSCTLISGSDAHSPEKLGREATVFHARLDYPSILQALKNPSADTFGGTLEFFPQEGKYHYDGHRKCRVRMSPEEARAVQNVCPRCGKPLTRGVAHRVMELRDRTTAPENLSFPHRHLISLIQILGEIHGKNPGSRAIRKRYFQVLKELETTELDLLLDYAPDTVENYDSRLAEALRRLRRREVIISEGYDGRYGSVRLFQPEELR